MIVAVTVTYNAKKDGILEPFLECVKRQRGTEFVLYVIDNASMDGTRDDLKNLEDSNTVVVLNDANVGFAAACNQGAEYARQLGADHIVFINNDTLFGDTLFADLANSLRRSGAAAISPIIVHSDRPRNIWYAGGGFRKLRGFVNVHYNEGRDLECAPAELFETEFAPGCCLMMPLAIFDEIGAFDERFFVYWEDMDLCHRMKLAGMSVVVDPSSRILHKGATSTGGKLSDFTIQQFNMNHMLFMRKHFGRIELIYTLLAISLKTSVNLAIRRLSLRQVHLKISALSKGLQRSKESGPV